VGDRLKSRGILTVSPEEGLQVMERLMDRDHVQAVVLRADWRRFLGQYPTERKPSMLSELTIEVQTQAKATIRLQKPVLLSQLEQASPAERRKLLQTHIREVIIQVLGLEPSFFIDPQQGLRDIGIDSLMSLELRNRLQNSTGQSLPSTLAFDFPTLDALVDYLAGRVLTQKSVHDIHVPQRPDSCTSNAEGLDDLSDEEAEALLVEELSKGRSGAS
jgi:acyl carrier protein